MSDCVKTPRVAAPDSARRHRMRCSRFSEKFAAVRDADARRISPWWWTLRRCTT